MRVYYIVCCDDGLEVSNELATLKAARKELKEIIKEDEDMGISKGMIDYYITKYTEWTENGETYVTMEDIGGKA